MKKRFTTLFMLLALALISISAQYTSDGLYTLQADNLSKYMSGGTPSRPMPMIESVTDDARFYIIENTANQGLYNIISLDQMYIASSTGAFGTLIENTEAHRDSANYGALVDLIDQGTDYRLESTPNGETKGWNGRRTGGTQVGMGTSAISGYNWTLTRIGDLPAPNAAPTDIVLSATAINENNFADALVGTLSATDPDAEDTFTFTFEADSISGADNDAFTINGDALTINESADYETKSDYKINVKVTDVGGLSFVKAFTITIIDFMETLGLTTDGIYTIHCKGKFTFMSADGIPGRPLPLKDSTSFGDDCKLYIVANPTDTTKHNIITLDGRYVASTTGAFGAWIENTADNRDSIVAAAILDEQATNEYYIETYIADGSQKLWNGQRNGSTAVGMGTTGGDNYTWNLTRIGDIPDTNVAATDIFLSVDNISENNAANDIIGMLSVSDANPFDTHTYSLATGDGTNDADNGVFAITDNVLTINDTADFEIKAGYNINIKVTDAGDLSFVKAFTISVNDVNEAPTDIALSDTAITENNVANALVGTLSATDTDAEDTFTFTFEADSINGEDNNAFTISGDALSINESSDYDTQSEYKINVKVTDAGGLSFVKALTITVSDFIEKEGLTGDGIYTIHCKGKSTFMSADGIPGKPLPLKDSTSFGDDCKLYIVANPADTTKHNIITLDGRYVASTTGAYGTWIENTAVNRDSIVAAAFWDEQATNEYYIETYITDGSQKLWNGQRNGSTAIGMGTTGGDNYTWNLTRIGDMPAASAATDIFLSVDSITEGNAANEMVGMLSVADANPFDTHTYSLATGDGTNDADNGAFTITDNVLTINDTVDFDAKASYSINIKVTDDGGLSFNKAFIISVIALPENTAPSDISLSATAIDENNAAGTTVGTLSASDADAEDTFSFTFEADPTNGADNDAFTISDDTLSLNASADYETKSEYKINVKVTDAGGLSFIKAFTITVNDLNDAPTAIALSSERIVENAAVGTLIGTLSATDVDANTTFSYTLSGTDAESFIVDNDSLKSAEIFDFETKTSFNITVTVSDGELSFNQDFTINIDDVVETAIGAIELSEVSFYPNPARDILTVKGLKVNATAYVYAVSGTLVKVAQLSEIEKSIDIRELSSGTYILKLAVEDGEIIAKIIK